MTDEKMITIASHPETGIPLLTLDLTTLGPVLTFRNYQGKPRVRIEAGDNDMNTAAVSVLDYNAQVVAEVADLGHNGSVMLAVPDAEDPGCTGATLWIAASGRNGDSAPAITLHDGSRRLDVPLTDLASAGGRS